MPPSSPGRSSACSLARIFAILFLLLTPGAALAQTDFLIVPFVGAKFAGHTSIAIGEPTVGQKKVTLGASTALLTDQFLGVEADLAHTPQFFGPGIQRTVSRSGVTTLTGSVILAVPKAITRESLRPYVVAGVGLMHARVSTQAGLLDTRSNLLGLDIGAGAIGFVSPRAGARFELRHFKNLTDDSAAVTIGGTRLSFWRFATGLVLKY